MSKGIAPTFHGLLKWEVEEEKLVRGRHEDEEVEPRISGSLKSCLAENRGTTAILHHETEWYLPLLGPFLALFSSSKNHHQIPPLDLPTSVIQPDPPRQETLNGACSFTVRNRKISISRRLMFTLSCILAVIVGGVFVILQTAPPASPTEGYNNEDNDPVPSTSLETNKPQEGTTTPGEFGGHPSFSPTNRPSSSSHPSIRPRTHEVTLKTYDAVIIGGGWAGLKAMETLVKSGISSVLLLEANDRVGGRAGTVNDDLFGIPTNLGAEWLYMDGDDMESYLNDLGLIDSSTNPADYYDPSNDEPAFFKQVVNKNDDGKTMITTQIVSEAEQEAMADKVWTGKDGFRRFSEKLAKQLSKKGEDESFADAIDEYEIERNIDGVGEQFLDAYAHFTFELEYGEDTKMLSVVDIPYYYGYVPRTRYMSNGFGNVAENFSERSLASKMMLNANVNLIDYQDTDQVTISFEHDGVAKKVQAQTVLVTVSLGVLKAGSIKFMPSLPSTKQNVIDSMGFGHLNKCVMYWENEDDVVWPDTYWIELMTLDDYDTDWKVFFNPTEFKGIPSLTGFFAGENVDEMENKSDEQVLDDVMKNLSSMFPTIRRPDSFIVTRWVKDEKFRGSYAYNKLNRNFEEDAAALKERVGPVWFAGEATSVEGWHGTTIGAWQTGREAAEEMASILRKKR